MSGRWRLRMSPFIWLPIFHLWHQWNASGKTSVELSQTALHLCVVMVIAGAGFTVRTLALCVIVLCSLMICTQIALCVFPFTDHAGKHGRLILATKT